jgi:Zn-dependent protease
MRVPIASSRLAFSHSWLCWGMLSSGKGSVRLFNLFGITVFLHWSWFLVAVVEIQSRADRYSSWNWNVIEYLSLFMIVLLHEFGHSLACRQVGGKAETIVLWPLGGVAFVNPPHRPGATLWSIAAGPLVNVVIAILLWPLLRHAQESGWAETMPDTLNWLTDVFKINAIIFIFNMLPIYPLDGGQILRSLLWFVCSAGRSLQIAVVIGFVGLAGMVYFAVAEQSFWLGVLCFFGAVQCMAGWTQSKALLKLESAGRWDNYRCPHCRVSPFHGAMLHCQNCNEPIDPFFTNAICPHCMHRHEVTICIFCRKASPLEDWSNLPKSSGTTTY